MKKIHSIILTMAVAGSAIAFSSCDIKRGEYVKGVGTIYCDDGFKYILEEEIDVFEYSYPDASIIPKYVSEADARDALLNDSTDAIIVTHEFTKDQIKSIRDKYKKVVKQRCIAVDAVALIVNKDNPINSLTMEELGQIMKGDITTWDKLALADTNNIQIVFDNANSSTVMYMREKFLNNKPISDNPKLHVYAQQNNLEVFNAVKNNPQALGIISVSWLGDTLQYARDLPVDARLSAYEEEDKPEEQLLTTEVKVLGLRNPTDQNVGDIYPYKPYQAYIASGEYPLVRKIWMITTASNSTVMKSFYDFVTGYVGQRIIDNTGILPYFMNPRVVELHQK